MARHRRSHRATDGRLSLCPRELKKAACPAAGELIKLTLEDHDKIMSTPSDRLKNLGFDLPPAPSALGIYKPAMTVGNLCYTSGHLPVMADGELMKGCIGSEVDQEFGYHAARQAGLTILSTLSEYLGSIDNVVRVVKLLGLVYCTNDFTQQPAVVNGCSELMRDVFGDDAGIGTRSAVGVAALPLGVTVEIEGIFEIK